MTDKHIHTSDLLRFTGASVWFRHPAAKGVLYTEGVKYLAEMGGAWWLVDSIAFAQGERDLPAEFQVWTLRSVADGGAVLCCRDVSGRLLRRTEIPQADFPLDEIRLFCVGGVLMLESEY